MLPRAAPARLLCCGIAVLDYVFGVDAIPTTPEKHRARTLAVVGGGLAANAAVAAARLGGAVSLATRLGEDGVGREIVEGLEAEGVDCALAKRLPGLRSPVSMIMIDKAGERLVMSYADPHVPDDPSWLPATLPAGTNAVLADTRWEAGAARLFDAARAANLPGVLDADRAPKDASLLRRASHIAFSAQALAELHPGLAPEAALARVARDTPAWVAVTVGAKGVHHGRGDDLRHTPGFLVPVVDTLAAGDVWHGAFALFLGEGLDEAEAVRRASAAAAIKCARFGGRAGAPTRAELESFLRDPSRAPDAARPEGAPA